MALYKLGSFEIPDWFWKDRDPNRRRLKDGLCAYRSVGQHFPNIAHFCFGYPTVERERQVLENGEIQLVASFDAKIDEDGVMRDSFRNINIYGNVIGEDIRPMFLGLARDLDLTESARRYRYGSIAIATLMGTGVRNDILSVGLPTVIPNTPFLKFTDLPTPAALENLGGSTPTHSGDSGRSHRSLAAETFSRFVEAVFPPLTVVDIQGSSTYGNPLKIVAEARIRGGISMKLTFSERGATEKQRRLPKMWTVEHQDPRKIRGYGSSSSLKSAILEFLANSEDAIPANHEERWWQSSAFPFTSNLSNKELEVYRLIEEPIPPWWPDSEFVSWFEARLG